MSEKPKILTINSLDARYGSTYRIRAFRDALQQSGHAVTYLEGTGGAWRRLWDVLIASSGRYDLLFTQKFNPITIAAMLVARLRRKPIVVDWDDLDVGLQGSPVKRWIAIICESMGPRLATGITTHSEIIQAAARSKGCSVRMISQGFDGDLFRPRATQRDRDRKRWGIADEDRVVSYLCTLTHGGAMDLPTVLRAWSAIGDPHVRFIIIGGGPLQSSVVDRLREHGMEKRVRVTGLLPHDEIPSLLNAIDLGIIFMSDTPANRARVSFKIIEYLAMNVPVVGQVVGETKRLFGEHITATGEERLSETIRDVLARKQSSSTSHVVESFEWRRAAEPLSPTLCSVYQGETAWA